MFRLLILIIFLLAVLSRFLYFPEDLYFAFDQARDGFKSLEVVNGDIKIIGPPSAASDKIFAGPLIYYIFGPIYFLGNNNPEVVSAFLRVWNSLGVFLVIGIGWILFNKWVGFLAGFFYAISYEASQYSLFLSHQPMASVTVLLFYLGLALFIFKKIQWGLTLSFLGLGLSIQFHFVYTLLMVVLILFFIIFKKHYQFSLKHIFYAVTIFLITSSTFILAEAKFQFRFLRTFFEGGGFKFYPQAATYSMKRFLHDNILASDVLLWIVGLLLTGALIYFLKKKEVKFPIIFLMVWFLVGVSPYLLSGTNSYYYSAAANVSLLLFISYVIYYLLSTKILLALLILIAVSVNNLYLIINNNPKGVNREFIIQPGMLLTSEKLVLDYIYQKAQGRFFAVNGLTVPLGVNTTWSYLFEWYGQQKYGYLPVWGMEVALGFPGHLKVETKRSNLPDKRFTILEPTVGIRDVDIKKFFQEENFFSKVVEEKKFGTIAVQYRQRI
ncbi:hypothetical protein HY386_00700 [Candidatus Daviesbacteria bacterium]|nr:hypothetical protein [Candidatus Daviesbacteria bacterium]